MRCKRCRVWVDFVTFVNAREEMCNECIEKAKAKAGEE